MSMCEELLKKAGMEIMAEQLTDLRGARSQEAMAEVCGIGLRHYSDFEHRKTTATALTMLSLYSAGIDLNKWAEDSIKLYNSWKTEQVNE